MDHRAHGPVDLWDRELRFAASIAQKVESLILYETYAVEDNMSKSRRCNSKDLVVAVALLGKEVPVARPPVDAPKVKSNDSFSLKEIVKVYSWAAATAPLSVCFVVFESTEI